jgi:hypothetical protein
VQATRTDQTCESSDTYRCVGCLVEQYVPSGRKFPKCPVCNRPTTWTLASAHRPPPAGEDDASGRSGKNRRPRKP